MPRKKTEPFAIISFNTKEGLKTFDVPVKPELHDALAKVFRLADSCSASPAQRKALLEAVAAAFVAAGKGGG